jgi:hypothetical protein
MKYPLGIQTFSEIREENYLYLDKTALIHDLINFGKVYFLSRPRRFGKSLLISTLEALFSGKKALFDGLAISQTDYDFATYPVVTIEFSSDEFSDAESLREHIDDAVSDIAALYGITLSKTKYNKRFAELVVQLHHKTGKKVVLLIDEYDKPLLNNLKKPALAEIKEVISAFYAGAKSLDKHLKFVLITGVSKFAKVSVFSGMNNITDISLDERYATLCGITQAELESQFDEPITQLALRDEMSKSQMLAKIKHWYNGYYFEENAISVYNPYSLLSLFYKEKFNNYWFTTATPTFLLDLLQDKQYELSTLSQFEIGDASFDACDPEDMDVLSLLVQTGYLTIKDYNKPLYVLDFPNYEVKKSFFDSIVSRFGKINTGLGQTYTHKLTVQIIKGELDAFFDTLRKFFANIPYDIQLKDEKYYQSLFYAIFTLLGLTIEAEVRTNQGRIDCVLQTADTIYIIEFKLNDTKEAALKQIHTKQYAQKYQNGDKAVVLLGVEFNKESRNIGGFLREDS